ncbi:DUF389 domain-containing protein [Patescibacteria group bacterium]|nr:DUF389 domain-containing protein [Patescibacteria group bacterium]
MSRNNKKSPKINFRNFVRHFFLSPENIERTRNNICDNAKGDFDFVLRTVFSVLVIALGLIIDSTSVVIGGMLIAPLFWPILGFSLGLIEGHSRLVSRSSITLVKSFAIIFVIALVVGLAAPTHILEAEEFTALTSPTIFDLFIGLAAGFLGAFIVAHPKISSSFAGVAIAAAVVPPLTASGIALSKGELDIFGTSFLLAIASLVSITFSASIFFFFTKLRTESYKALLIKRKEDLLWFMIALIIVIVPLALLTNQIIKKTDQKNIATEIITSRLDDAGVADVKVSEKNKIVNIDVVLRREKEITDAEMSDISNGISNELRQSISLKLRTVPVVDKAKIVNFR